MSLPCLYRSTETRVSVASWNSLGCSALHSSQVVSRSNTDAVFVTGGSQSDTTWGRKREGERYTKLRECWKHFVCIASFHVDP